MQHYSQSEIDNSKSEYLQLFDEINRLSGTLAGGTKQPVTKDTFKSLTDNPIEFGNPRNELIRIKEDSFETSGLALSAVAKRQLSAGDFHFYYMSINLLLKAPNGVQYSELYMQLDFGPKGKTEPIIHSLFPTTEWNSVLRFGGGFHLGLDANLKWKIGVTTPDMITSVGELSTQIENSQSMTSFIVVPEFLFDSGRMEIGSTGTAGSTAWWSMGKISLKANLSPKFGIIFKVPTDVDSIRLEGKVMANTYLPWLVAQLRHIWDRLSDNAKRLLQGEGSTNLPVGSHEIWENIILPD